MAKNRIEELTSRPLRTYEETVAEPDEAKGEPAAEIADPPWEQTEPSAPEPAETPPPVKTRDNRIVFTGKRRSEPEIAVAEPPQAEPPPEPEKAPADPPSGMSSNNDQKLRQAIKHLERYFRLADAEQIEGRKFFGETTITVKWRNGQAQIICPAMNQTDTGMRDGK